MKAADPQNENLPSGAETLGEKIMQQASDRDGFLPLTKIDLCRGGQFLICPALGASVISTNKALRFLDYFL